MLKKHFLIIGLFGLVLLCFYGCTSPDEGKNNTILQDMRDEKLWLELAEPYSGPIVADREAAIEIAVAIYHSISNGEDTNDYIPQHVLFDEEAEVWTVSFCKPKNDSDTIVLGGSYNIAIRKQDVKVIGVWFGE